MNKPTDYTITLTVNIDEVETLKEAILSYAKSKEVTVENFDLVRNLYGKIAPAWSRRTSTEQTRKAGAELSQNFPVHQK